MDREWPRYSGLVSFLSGSPLGHCPGPPHTVVLEVYRVRHGAWKRPAFIRDPRMGSIAKIASPKRVASQVAGPGGDMEET